MSDNGYRKFFSDEEAPLPLHVITTNDTPVTPETHRVRPAPAADASRYWCIPFYKLISRPIYLPMAERNINE